MNPPTKEKKECPVCFQKLSSRQTLSLECGHVLCFSCANHWLPENKTCPLCRSLSDRFSYRTRSFTASHELCETIKMWLHYLDVYFGSAQSFFDHHLTSYVSFLDQFICQQKTLWYRPDMKIYLIPLQKKLLPFQNLILQKCLQENNDDPHSIVALPFINHPLSRSPRDILHDFFSI